MKKEPLTSYHRVENVDIAYNTFLNCSLELGSGRGDKLPKNVRFANNLYAGEVPQLKIINADELLPGFLFMDNHWAFTDKSTLDAVPYERMRTGFKAVGKSVGLDMIEKKRVDTCIFAAGPSWYQPSKEFINYIDLHR